MKEGDKLHGVVMNCALPSKGNTGRQGTSGQEQAGSFQEVMAAIGMLCMPGQFEKAPVREGPAQILSSTGAFEQALPLGLIAGDPGEAFAQEQLSLLQGNMPVDTALSTQAGGNGLGQAMSETGSVSEVAEVPGAFISSGKEAALATGQSQRVNLPLNVDTQKALFTAQKTPDPLAGSNSPQLDGQAAREEHDADQTVKKAQLEQMPKDLKAFVAGQEQKKLQENPFARSSSSLAGQLNSPDNETYTASTAEKLHQGSGGSQAKPEGAWKVFNTPNEIYVANTAEKLNQGTGGSQVKPEAALHVFNTINETHAAATTGKPDQRAGGNQVKPEVVLNIFNTTLETPAGTATGKEGVAAAQAITHEPQGGGNNNHIDAPNELMMHHNAILSGANHGSKEKAVPLPEVKNIVAQEIISMIKSDEVGRPKQVQLKLEPEHLGQLTIRLFFDRDEVSAHFYTANNQVKELLEGSMQQLRDSLSQYDLKLNEAFVYNGNDNRGGRSSGGQEGQAGPADRQYNQGYVEKELGQLNPITEQGSPTKIDYLI
jgi:flagellar hook-length control protein FliK